jgi:CRP-like cAMP-binding protein
MFFISRGTVRILSFKNLNNSQVLSDGEFFGEIALLHPTKRRTASIFAESYCYMYSLDVDDMNQVLEQFPHIRRQFMAEAQSRLEAIEDEERKMLQTADTGMNYELSKASVQDWYKRSSNMKGRASTRNMSTFSRASRSARPMGLSDFVNSRQSQAQRRGTIMRM